MESNSEQEVCLQSCLKADLNISPFFQLYSKLRLNGVKEDISRIKGEGLIYLMSTQIQNAIHRGYHTVARTYELYLRSE